MQNIFTVRRATLDDLPAIVDGNMQMAKETEATTLDRATVTDGVRAALLDNNKGLYFVAEIDGCVAGTLMVTYEWSDWRNGQIWWIQSVYILPQWRRRGAFRALYRHVHQLARTNNAKGIRLYVEQTNSVAQTTYERIGMQRSDYMIYEEMFVELRKR